MNFRERLEQVLERQGNNNESVITEDLEGDFACEYFATDNIHRLPACLDLRFADGKRKALPYCYFVEMHFDTENGIEITTSTKKVTISGRNLSKLFDYLVAYRVRYITSHVGVDINEDGIFIQKITVEDYQG